MCRHNERAACVHRDKTETMQEIVTEGNTQPLQQNLLSTVSIAAVRSSRTSAAVSPRSTASSRSESTRSDEWSQFRCAVCLSVPLSVTFVDHVKTNKRTFEIFSPSRSHASLVFPYQMGRRYSDGNYLTEASNAGRV